MQIKIEHVEGNKRILKFLNYIIALHHNKNNNSDKKYFSHGMAFLQYRIWKFY